MVEGHFFKVENIKYYKKRVNVVLHNMLNNKGYHSKLQK